MFSLSASIMCFFLTLVMANFASVFAFSLTRASSHKLCDCRTNSSTDHPLRGIISHNCPLPHSPALESSAMFYAASFSYVRSTCNSDCQATKFSGPLG
ncbi:hypothetical protein BFJ65_g7396 [Fusarium oxysporum f. sp. cepae]|uniref:Secreted protein n=1 Tax=Fusarium oxysporum f. sp. cepae TaxID=396571 RepID=A0A3L6NS78_FUSOX|nr:hypothetical protein BFJ65_g7396 [Fusarium oxysporum f. sp. cepae]